MLKDGELEQKLQCDGFALPIRVYSWPDNPDGWPVFNVHWRWRGIRGQTTFSINPLRDSSTEFREVLLSRFGTKEQMDMHAQDVVCQTISEAIESLQDLEKRLLDSDEAFDDEAIGEFTDTLAVILQDPIAMMEWT